jgi:hypothetical protein
MPGSLLVRCPCDRLKIYGEACVCGLPAGTFRAGGPRPTDDELRAFVMDRKPT